MLAQGLIVSERRRGEPRPGCWRACWTPVERFNVADGWRMLGDDASGALRLLRGDETLATAQWALSGEHNRATSPSPRCWRRATSARPLESAWRRWRVSRTSSGGWSLRGTNGRERLRRFRASPDGDRDACRPGERSRPPDASSRFSNRARTHEARWRQESPVAGEPGRGRPGLSATRAANLGWDAAEALAPMGEKASVADELDALVAGALSAKYVRRSHSGDEQRWLWRHSRQAAAGRFAPVVGGRRKGGRNRNGEDSRGNFRRDRFFGSPPCAW